MGTKANAALNVLPENCTGNCAILYRALMQQSQPKILCWSGIKLSICLSTSEMWLGSTQVFYKIMTSHCRCQSRTLLIISVGYFLQRFCQNFPVITVQFHMAANALYPNPLSSAAPNFNFCGCFPLENQLLFPIKIKTLSLFLMRILWILSFPLAVIQISWTAHFWLTVLHTTIWQYKCVHIIS